MELLERPFVLSNCSMENAKSDFTKVSKGFSLGEVKISELFVPFRSELKRTRLLEFSFLLQEENNTATMNAIMTK